MSFKGRHTRLSYCNHPHGRSSTCFQQKQTLRRSEDSKLPRLHRHRGQTPRFVLHLDQRRHHSDPRAESACNSSRQEGKLRLHHLDRMRDTTDALQAEWPLVLTTFKWTQSMPFPVSHHHDGRSVIVFKVHSGEDTLEFAASLHGGGLRRKGRTMHEVPDGSFWRFMNEWWYRFLLQSPKKQEYW